MAGWGAAVVESWGWGVISMSAAPVAGQLAAGVLGVASGASWRLSGDAVELLELQP